MLGLLLKRYRSLIGIIGTLMIFWSFGYFSAKSQVLRHDKCLYINGYPDCHYFLNAVKLSESLKPDYTVHVNRVERGEKWIEFRNSIIPTYPEVKNHFTSPIIYLDDCSGGNNQFVGGFDRFSEIIDDLK